MKVIASAIAAALTTTTATVSLAAMVAVAPAAQETAVFETPLSAEIVTTVAGWDFDADATAAIVTTAAAEAAAEPEAVEPEPEAEVAEPAAEPAAEAPVAEPAAEPADEPVLAVPHTGVEDIPAAEAPVMTPGTISVAGGSPLGYIDYFEMPAAPEHGAGLWLGSESTTDGSWGYFIGHNPGDFSAVMGLQGGDPVTVCDRAGNSRTYYVVDAFIVGTETYWSDIESRVTGYGESIVVQTCVGDDLHYRVVVCA